MRAQPSIHCPPSVCPRCTLCVVRPIADELGCSLAQLAIAWAAANPNVSTVILGATKLNQLEETLKARGFSNLPKKIPGK